MRKAPAAALVVALILSVSSHAQDLSVPGADPETLRRQIAALEPMIARLRACAEQPGGFGSVKEVCRQALAQRSAQQTILQEIAQLQQWKASADLPANVQQAIHPQITELTSRYTGLGAGLLPASAPSTAAAGEPARSSGAAAPGTAEKPPRNPQAPAQQNPTSKKSTTAKQRAEAEDETERVGRINCLNRNTENGLCGGYLMRSIVGFEQAGVSSAESQQKFFFDLLVSRPAPLFHRKQERTRFGNDAELGPWLRTWGNLRITSVPQQINTSVAQFASQFAQTVGNLKVNEVAQSFEFLGGVDIRLVQTRSVYLSFDHRTSQRFSLNLILGGGVITPITPRESVQVFRVPTNQPAFFSKFPEAMGKQFVAFALPNRDRFFRQAYGGLRLMTHFQEDNTENPKTRFPATFDVTYGFNESVTGGRIRGGVVRLEGFLPLPYSAASWIYLFGTGMFKPGAKARIERPFLLDPAPQGTLPTDPSAVVIITPQTDRDYYRVGIGIDFIDLVRSWRRASQEGKNPQQSTQNGDSNQRANTKP